MPHEAYVQLVCPECQKTWEENPRELPASEQNYECPNCNATRRTAEFMRTDSDFETLKQFEGA
ncbi:MAG: hypothetical protein ABEJ59_04710 [Halanaeroarchaeum sp.]